METARAVRTPPPAMGPGLAGAQAPPFLLPGVHFAAAMGFALLGAFALIAIAPDLAAGFYISPRVAGVTHFFTLGWLTTSIMGALYQLLPVVLSQPVRSQRAAYATFALYVPGLAAFIAGLLTGAHPLMLSGAAAFGTGVLVFLVNLGLTLKRATRRGLTWWALVAAATFLLITLILGVSLAANLRWGFLGANRLNALGVHLHVALAGWVLLVVVGIGLRLLPMFLLSHGAREHWARAAVWLIAGGAGVLSLGHHAPPLFSRWLPLLLIFAGLAAFLVQARQFYAHRIRAKQLDAGMRLAAAGLALLGVGLVLAPVVVLGFANAPVATAYVTALVLGFSVFVAAHYYKILPFLVWYHRFGPLAGKRPVPRVNELYGARLANAAAALIALGAFALVASVAFGQALPARAAAALFAAGLSIEAMQMVAIARRRP